MDSRVLDLLRTQAPARAALDALAPGDGVHLVGGAVRDLLLGRIPAELDFVVEGDAAAVARGAAARLGGEAVVHERFGTATVRWAHGAFDLASARREVYRAPGALPDVSLGASLPEDLARRDFTVNAIAVGLAGGELQAAAHALEDLRARRLRVLHPASFADDPTRLLRMCRYAARLGFSPERATAALAAAAVAAGVLDTVSGERLGRELRLLAREVQPAGLLALATAGIGAAALLPAFAPRRETLAAALALCPPDARADLVALAATMAGAGQGELEARLTHLAFPAAERAILLAAATRAPALTRALGQAASPAAVDAQLLPERIETVAVAGGLAAGSAAEAAVSHWLRRVRGLALAVTGADLRAAGLTGPRVGQGLRAARAALIEGRAPDPASQLAAALAAAGDESPEPPA